MRKGCRKRFERVLRKKEGRNKERKMKENVKISKIEDKSAEQKEEMNEKDQNRCWEGKKLRKKTKKKR